MLPSKTNADAFFPLSSAILSMILSSCLLMWPYNHVWGLPELYLCCSILKVQTQGFMPRPLQAAQSLNVPCLFCSTKLTWRWWSRAWSWFMRLMYWCCRLNFRREQTSTTWQLHYWSMLISRSQLDQLQWAWLYANAIGWTASFFQQQETKRGLVSIIERLDTTRNASGGAVSGGLATGHSIRGALEPWGLASGWMARWRLESARLASEGWQHMAAKFQSRRLVKKTVKDHPIKKLLWETWSVRGWPISKFYTWIRFALIKSLQNNMCMNKFLAFFKKEMSLAHCFSPGFGTRAWSRRSKEDCRQATPKGQLIIFQAAKKTEAMLQYAFLTSMFQATPGLMKRHFALYCIVCFLDSTFSYLKRDVAVTLNSLTIAKPFLKHEAECRFCNSCFPDLSCCFWCGLAAFVMHSFKQGLSGLHFATVLYCVFLRN